MLPGFIRDMFVVRQKYDVKLAGGKIMRNMGL